jgi:fatty acid desaturase
VEIVGKSEPEASTKARELAAPRKAAVAAWKIYVAVAVAIAIVWQFYYFRELAAALLLFTIIFLVLAVIGGAIYLIGRISQKTFSIAEPAARRGLVYAEVISRKTFHRPRSVPVP